MNESRRETEFRYLDENETVGWLDARCTAIAEGRPFEHCWKDYCLRRRTFMAWLHRKPERVKAVAAAMGMAQLQRMLRIEVEHQANRAAHRRGVNGDIGI